MSFKHGVDKSIGYNAIHSDHSSFQFKNINEEKNMSADFIYANWLISKTIPFKSSDQVLNTHETTVLSHFQTFLSNFFSNMSNSEPVNPYRPTGLMYSPSLVGKTYRILTFCILLLKDYHFSELKVQNGQLVDSVQHFHVCRKRSSKKSILFTNGTGLVVQAVLTNGKALK